MEERQSQAAAADLISDPEEKARAEARNALCQFDKVIEMVEYWTATGHPPFQLRPSAILTLHREALQGLDSFAGNYRPGRVTIGGSKHQPCEAFLVPEEVERLCDHINEKWDGSSPIYVAAYSLWRMNWVHPFTDGNGRTARALSYLLLSVRLGYKLPGVNTIPEQISTHKDPYYSALEAGDAGELGPMENMMETMLANQLASVLSAAATQQSPSVTDPTFH